MLLGRGNLPKKLLIFNFRSEYIYKYDLTDDKEADTLEFTLRKTYIFKPELSNGLTGDEIITTLHPGKF